MWRNAHAPNNVGWWYPGAGDMLNSTTGGGGGHVVTKSGRKPTRFDKRMRACAQALRSPAFKHSEECLLDELDMPP